MKYEIKKIDILSCAKFAGLFYVLVGLVPAVIGLAAMLFNRGGFDMENLAILLFPVGFFVGGFVAGAVFAVVYNLLAKEIGGIKLDIEYNED